MLERLTIDHFRPLAGTNFRAAFPDRVIELELLTIKSLAERYGGRASREPFSLVFRGPNDVMIPQSTYIITHEAFPEPLTIFIVPIARHDDGFRYEAIFA